MVDTLAQFEADEEQKRAQLETPAAVRERKNSRGSFIGIPASQAQQLFLTTFGDVLGSLNADMARTLANADVIRPLGMAGALIEVEGRKQLMEGTGPVQIEDSQGNLRKIDLTLKATGGTFEPVNPLVELVIPPSAAESISIGDTGLEVAHVDGEISSHAQPLGEMNVFYPEVQEDTDLLVAPLSTGVEFFDQLRSEESPETLRFEFDLPSGSQLLPDGNAAQVIASDGSKQAIISPPTAIDAQGSPVPVQMKVDGNSLALEVTHREGDFAYPILVDPIIQEWYWQNWYQGHNLHALSNGAWQWWTSEGPGSSYVYGSTGCIFSCWGSGRGLYIDTPNGNLPANRWGRWRYVAPNSATYLANAWISPFFLDDHGNCPRGTYGQPYDYIGMYNETAWNRIVYDTATNPAFQGGVDIQSWGRLLDIGMGTSSGISIPCWRDVMAGGVRIWLEDWSRPDLTTSTNSQWMDTARVRLPASAYDAGLGVKKFKATAINKAGGTEEWWNDHSCTGLYEAPCPHTWNLGNSGQPELNFSPANLPEGIRKLSVTAYDAAEKPSFTTNEVDIRVDHSAPVITLSGTLTEQSTLGTERPRYTIRADATDGNPASSNPADARAGVTKLTFEVDDKLARAPYEPGCPTQSCSQFQELEVPASEMTTEPHTLRVKAWDKYGHIAKKELSFATGDTQDPVLTVQGGPLDSSTPTFSTSFGSTGTGAGQFSHSGDVAIDPKGNLWVADMNNSRIQKFSANGEFLMQFGSNGTANGQLKRPAGVAIDPKGNVWVADANNNRIQKFSESGEYLAKIGSWGTGNGQFKGPEGIDVDAKGNVWVADTANGRIQVLNENAGYVKTISSQGSEPGQLGEPSRIDVGPGGKVWVTDWQNSRVVAFGESGQFLKQFGSYGSADGQFKHADGLAVDGLGNVWVSDEFNHRIQRFNEDGEYLTKFGIKGSGSGQFNFSSPIGIAADSAGGLWITDGVNDRMQKWVVPGVETGGYARPISATASDTGFGVVSITVQLTNASGQTEPIEEASQSCPNGACPFIIDFDELYLSGRPPGPYTLTVVAKDAAGNTSSFSRLIGLNSNPPTIALSGSLAERDGLPLNASSGELNVQATDDSLVHPGVKAIYVEREGQRVAAFPTNCSSGCDQANATYRYSATRDGAARSTEAITKPSGSTLTSLSGASCLSTSNCTAVGHTTSSSLKVPLVERWDGTTWQVQTAPKPSSSFQSRLEGISCTSATHCIAVGYYQGFSGGAKSLVEHWDGSNWSIMPTPNPSGYANAYLYGVSCAASNDCWAVGKSAYTAAEEAGGKKSTALLEHWDGTAWAIAASPEGAPESLKRVFCSSGNSCVAVSGTGGLSVQRWNGTSWSSQPVAAPTSGSGVALKDVSCASASACTVVGSYSVEGRETPLVERWNGTGWSVQASISPVGIIDEVESSSLEAVSCPTSSSCTAVGTRKGAGETLPIVQGWDGTDWALQPAAIPSGTSTATPSAVACSGAFDCTAVGNHGSTSSPTALVQREEAGVGEQHLTVEAVDRFGQTATERIVVDEPELPTETPSCTNAAASVSPQGAVSATEAANAAQESVPETVAASQPTSDPNSEKQIDPTYSAPQPNLESLGTEAEGETAVTPVGGFTLEGIACITPTTTTSAATNAKVVNGDAAIFANTAPHTDTLVRPTAGGTTVVQLLRGSGSPTSGTWRVHVSSDETLIKLPSGAIAVTRPVEGEAEGTAEISKPEGAETPEALADAGIQLESSEYQLARAQSETAAEVVAVIARPWVVLNQGGVVPAKIELTTTAVPTEYNVTYTLPPFEPNYFPEAVVMEASASAVVNGQCPKESPCGTFNVERAVNYARQFGPGYGETRNLYYVDYGDNNCTNFLSQVLTRGEMSFMRAFEHGDGSWWYKRYTDIPSTSFYYDYDDTESWRFADKLPRHLWRFGLAVIDSNEPSGWTAGNIVAEDWFGTNGQGDINHVQFVDGTIMNANGVREPTISNSSSPDASYSGLRWAKVKENIEAAHKSNWTRFSLAVEHTTASLSEKKRDPDNLYGPNGLFNG